MTYVDWNALVLGLVIGIALSTAYFAGLGYGMRLALRAGQPAKILLFSSALRMSALLTVGWVVVSQAGPWAFWGYGVSFFVARMFAMRLARTRPTVGEQPWN